MKLSRILPSSRIARAAVSLAVLASLVAISVIVTGATGGAPQPSEEENPLEADAQSYAADFGTTVEEAMRRLSLQNEIGKLDEQLTTNEGQTFAGLWIKHEPEFAVIVKFTENGADTIQPYVIGGDLVDLVEVGTAPNTLTFLENAQAAVAETVKSVGVRFNSRVNVPENEVEVLTLDKVDLKSKLNNAGKALPSDVEIIEVSKLAKPAANIYGGLGINACTSGFAVEDSSGTKGITTASHCPDAQSYNGNVLDFEDESYGGSADVEWRTAPGLTVKNKIKTSPTKTRNITGIVERDSQPIAAYVCKYGNVTGHGCGQIASKTYQPDESDLPCPNCNWNATFIEVRASAGQRLSQQGDSGGPFYVGGNAWGTMVMDVEWWQGGTWLRSDAIYMAVDYIGLMDVDVLTN